jgi:predicted GNAT superfamily acetyltransferase
MRRVAYKIRLLRDHEEYRQAEGFQRTVWNFADREIIPLNELVVTQRNGGFVFGAFDDEGRMAAFCFGMPGIANGRPYHYSRMLGVLPEVQDQGLGYRLKMFQRRLVLKQGLGLVKWTVDPLQSRNAHFNVEKLGVIIRDYAVNLYGGSSSRFNQGLETDRFIPEWHIRSRRVRERLRGRGSDVSVENVAGGIGFATALEVTEREGRLVPETVRLNIRDRKVSVEIPANIDQIKAVDLALAREWRLETRKILTRLFQRGYVVCGFSSGQIEGRRRSFYLLEKGFRVR